MGQKQIIHKYQLNKIYFFFMYANKEKKKFLKYISIMKKN